VVNKPASKVVARAIASLEKKAAAREVRWKEACAAEQKERARRDELVAFVERYLRLRDELIRESAEWYGNRRRRYVFAVLREVRAQRRQQSR
jgi:hypothetical protein